MGKLELVEESDRLSIFSPKYNGEKYNEFEKFMLKFESVENPYLAKDFKAIISTVSTMLEECGARENLFRPEGRNIGAVPLIIERRRPGIGTLRLYCIRISDEILIIGNGGLKKVKKYQEDTHLLNIVNSLKELEHILFIESKKRHIDYADFEEMKKIIRKITL